MQKYGSFFFVLIFIVFMFIARMSETLICESQSETTIECERIQDRIFYESHRKYQINDLESVQLNHGKIRRKKHNIVALTAEGKKVVLLSVPEKNVSYAEDLISQLKTLPTAEEKRVEFTRSEMHSQLLLLSVVGLVVIVSIVILLRSNKRRR